MGGAFDTRVYEIDDKAKIKADFEAACEQAKVEDGESYPGTIAAMRTVVEWQDRGFSTQREASEHLCDVHEKWEEAIAVSFHLPKPFDEKRQERINDMRERADQWRERVRKAQRDAVDNFKARKSTTVGCSGCKSRLDHSRIAEKASTAANIYCPLCHTSLIAKPDLERINKLQARVEKANEDLREASVPETNGALGWVVGGWCSS
jgi:hypothetical protein